jgi:hypothetical protein
MVSNAQRADTPPAPNKRVRPTAKSKEKDFFEDFPSPGAQTIADLHEIDSQQASVSASGSSSEPTAPAELLVETLIEAGLSEGRAELLVDDDDSLDLINALVNRLGPSEALLEFLRGSRDEVLAAAESFAAGTPLEDVIDAKIIFTTPHTPTPRSVPDPNPFGLHATQESNPPRTPAAQLVGKGKNIPIGPPLSPLPRRPLSSRPAPITYLGRKKIEAAPAKREEEVQTKEGTAGKPVGEREEARKHKEQREDDDKRKREKQREEEKRQEETRKEEKRKVEEKQSEDEKRREDKKRKEDAKRREEETRKEDEQRQEEKRKEEERREEEKRREEKQRLENKRREEARNKKDAEKRKAEERKRREESKRKEEERKEVGPVKPRPGARLAAGAGSLKRSNEDVSTWTTLNGDGSYNDESERKRPRFTFGMVCGSLLSSHLQQTHFHSSST